MFVYSVLWISIPEIPDGHRCSRYEIGIQSLEVYISHISALLSLFSLGEGRVEWCSIIHGSRRECSDTNTLLQWW